MRSWLVEQTVQGSSFRARERKLSGAFMEARARIPLHQPWIGEAEEEAVLGALRQGLLAGNGPLCRRLEKAVGDKLAAPFVFAVNSGTAALELAVLSLGLGPGDDVLVPSFTFVTTVSAIVRSGAHPVFVDIDPTSFNMSLQSLRDKITKTTKALICVHYAGVPCEMDDIAAFAAHHRLKIIEDAAHALGASWKGRAIGTLGDAGCFSLHESKNFTCGEGGILVLADGERGRRVRLLREKGTDRQSYIDGEVPSYHWYEIGSSYTLSDILAALALAQLEKFEKVLSARRECASDYATLLKHPCLRVQRIPRQATSAHHLFPVLVPAPWRSRLIQALDRAGIDAAPHYPPLHLSPLARRLFPSDSHRQGLDCTCRVSQSLLRLPMGHHLQRNDVAYIAQVMGDTLEDFAAGDPETARHFQEQWPDELWKACA